MFLPAQSLPELQPGGCRVPNLPVQNDQSPLPCFVTEPVTKQTEKKIPEPKLGDLFYFNSIRVSIQKSQRD